MSEKEGCLREQESTMKKRGVSFSSFVMVDRSCGKE